MDSFLLAFNLVFPLFLLLLLGHVIRRTSLVNEETVTRLNTLVFKIFLPVSIFKNVYDSELAEVFDAKLIAYGVGSVLLCFLLLFAVVPCFCKKKESCGALIQGIFRSNFLIYGLPVAQSLYKDGSLDGKASVLIAIIVPVYNVLAVLALEMFRGSRPSGRKILRGVASNPLIMGSLCGFLGLFLKQVPLIPPSPVYQVVGDVAKIATPLALIALGASLDFSKIRGNIVYIVWGILGKLVVMPMLFISLAVLLGFRDRELAIVLAMYVSPAAVSSYTMAQQMEADDVLAGQLVVFGTAVSIFTVFFWVFFMTHLGLIVPIG